ncbi:hypothetical protein CN934_29745 [Ensifer sp. MMN_5]|nr:hypothetical protein CN934_29745 [Ensifer sp. MMN_5]
MISHFLSVMSRMSLLTGHNPKVEVLSDLERRRWSNADRRHGSDWRGEGSSTRSRSASSGDGRRSLVVSRYAEYDVDDEGSLNAEKIDFIFSRLYR